jgi:hypothetical protein
MSNSSGFAAIDDMIARIRGLPDAIKAAAPSLAEAAKGVLDENIAASRGPDGTAWKPKKEGGAPLAHAANALSSRASGTVLLLELRGPEVWHHFGTKHVPARPILPSTGLPLTMAAAIKRGVVEVFKNAVSK